MWGPSYWGPGNSPPLGSTPLPLPWCLCPFVPRRGWPAGSSDHHPNPALLVHSPDHQLHLMENLPPAVSGHPPPPATHMRAQVSHLSTFSTGGGSKSALFFVSHKRRNSPRCLEATRDDVLGWIKPRRGHSHMCGLTVQVLLDVIINPAGQGSSFCSPRVTVALGDYET